MSDEPALLAAACARLAGAIRERQGRRSAPMLVALDGHSGAGKSTLAECLVECLDAALLPMDDFFAAEIPDPRWDQFTPRQRFEHAFDWARLRGEALIPLLAGEPARWYAFDFVAGQRPDGTYPMQTTPKVLQPAPAILLDGAFSAGPQLAHLVDLRVLVEAPEQVRNSRLEAREQADFLRAWHTRWDPVLDLYFNHIRPVDAFDLVVRLG